MLDVECALSRIGEMGTWTRGLLFTSVQPIARQQV
jgi:hypothetical protein